MVPIIYEQNIDLHFSDFDMFGHVNSKHYVDYVVSSRFKYIANTYGLNQRDFLNKGYGFYITKTEMNFKKSIVNTISNVDVKSWVEKISDTLIKVPFEIKSESGEVFCYGSFTCHTIDIKAGRTIEIPKFMEQIFFEN
ncbi:MAG: acyl-CoA thioesterase [Ekhidna sp.]